MRLFAFLLPLCLSLFACQQTDKPETVVLKWQSHIDNNEFREAMTLSAPRTIELLYWMEGLLAEMDPDSMITHTELLNLSCVEKGDRAVCYYAIEDEGIRYPDSFLLVRVDGKWLIDLPEIPAYEEEDDALLETFFQDQEEE